MGKGGYNTPKKLAMHREVQRRYRARHHEKVLEIERSYRKRVGARARKQRAALLNPEKVKARIAVRSAVSKGRLIKPDHCSDCGRPTPKAQLHGHHHKGYAKEHRLNVVWLCTPCHNEAEKISP